jgi:hypothetical protein
MIWKKELKQFVKWKYQRLDRYATVDIVEKGRQMKPQL